MQVHVFLAFLASTIISFYHGKMIANAEVWPRPKNVTQTERVLHFRPHHFRWRAEGKTSPLLFEAFDRYSDIIFGHSMPYTDLNPSCADYMSRVSRILTKKNAITGVDVCVTSSDQSLGVQTSEAYTIRVRAPTIRIEAETVFGILRALETLAQLSYELEIDENLAEAIGEEPVIDLPEEQWEDDGLEKHHHKHHHKHKKHHHHKHHHHRRTRIIIHETVVHDKPRFPWRGLLIDSSRHYLPLSIIKKHLDAMSMAKLNVLHWHLIDDQSFPLLLDWQPELAERGAYSSEAMYNRKDVEGIVEYARERGIRVIPEFDTPSHMSSWGFSHPEILTKCFQHGKPTGVLGPANPADELTYSLIWRLLREAAGWFPDGFVHLGGDEVNVSCWESNPKINEWAKKQGLVTSYLQRYHTRKVLDMAKAAGKAPVLWEEAAEGIDGDLPENAVVQVWRWDKQLTQDQRSRSKSAHFRLEQRKILMEDPYPDTTELLSSVAYSVKAPTEEAQKHLRPLSRERDEYWMRTMRRITKNNLAILSAPWYLDHVAPEIDAWEKLWAVNVDFLSDPVEKDRMLGGTACMWGELVDETNALSKTWPLASAVAERLWSPLGDLCEARRRFEEHRCRMLLRDIPAAPIGPGHCPFDGYN